MRGGLAKMSLEDPSWRVQMSGRQWISSYSVAVVKCPH